MSTATGQARSVDVGDRLAAHLRAYLGAWPPPGPGLTVVGAAVRERPVWDGRVRQVIGVTTPNGGVLSVTPHLAPAVAELGTDLDDIEAGIAEAMGLPGWRLERGVFRWTGTPTEGDDVGVWLPVTDPRIPAWLYPFGGDALVAMAHDAVVAGVGLKRHDRFGHELAVVTEEAHRGQGLARRLVAQAARRVLARGAVPTYLHDPVNVASAKTAEASGFPDRGWQVLGLFPAGEPSS